MTNPAATCIEDTPLTVSTSALKPWIDPICVEIAVEELTAAGPPGTVDIDIFS